jgi:hypothetical protein
MYDDDAWSMTTEGIVKFVLFFPQVESLGDERVRPVITPRFVPSCTRDLLTGEFSGFFF